MNENTPLISVVIPTWNRADLISESIDSVFGQECNFSFEIIVANDGSTDNTRTLLEETYGSKIRAVHQSNKGVSSARNLGVKESKGEFVAFLDSDDLMLPTRLQQQTTFLQEHASCGLVASNYTAFSSKDNIDVTSYFNHQPFGIPTGENGIITRYFVNSLAVGNPLFSTAMVRKDVFVATGGFDCTLYKAEDFELSARFAAVSDIGIIDTPLVAIRNAGHDRLSHTDSPLPFKAPECYEAMINVWLNKHKNLVKETPGFRDHVGHWCSSLSMQYWGNRNKADMERVIREFWPHLSLRLKFKAVLCMAHLLLLKLSPNN